MLRTLLSYPVASFAVAIFVTVLYGLLPFGGADASSFASGDPQVMAGAVSETLLVAFGVFVLSWFSFGLIWILVRVLAKLVGINFSGIRLLQQGALVGAVNAALYSLILVFERVFHLALVTSTEDLATPIEPLAELTGLVVTILAGVVWGAAFWLLEPRNSNVGHAA